MSGSGDGVGAPEERDDYGRRPDGSRNLWVARIVRGPVVLKADGSVRQHGGQIEARTCPARSAAVTVAQNMLAFYRMEVRAGARVWIEPGFYSKASMPGARFCFVTDDESGVVYPPSDLLSGL